MLYVFQQTGVQLQDTTNGQPTTDGIFFEVLAGIKADLHKEDPKERFHVNEALAEAEALLGMIDKVEPWKQEKQSRKDHQEGLVDTTPRRKNGHSIPIVRDCDEPYFKVHGK